MDIDVTDFLASEDPALYSASAAELGDNAGRITWGNALEYRPHMLTTDDQRAAFRQFVRWAGGWTRDEIDAWTDDELNALFTQWVAGDARECGYGERDWPEIYADQEAGQVPSSLFEGVDGRVYFYIGS